MDKKIISISSIIFAIIFIGIFLVIWGATQEIIKNEADEINNQYATNYDFDISFLDNHVVTTDTVINLAYNIKDSGYSQSVKIKFYRDNNNTIELIGSEDSYLDYENVINELKSIIQSIDSNDNNLVKTTFSVTNSNDVIDGILIIDD